MSALSHVYLGMDPAIQDYSVIVGLPIWQNYSFPADKKKIARLNYDEKMQWYATRVPKDVVFLGNDPEFQRFWKWHVVIPVKIRRMYYRIKNLEVFKHYKHISEMKPKVKKYGI